MTAWCATSSAARLGGPIATDRLFFFGAYQGTRATQTPADIVTFIPTAAMLAGDFTQIASAACRAQGNLNLPAPFVGNRISPALLSPAAVKISQRLPTTTDPCGRIAYSRKTLPREGQSIGRIDWQISQNHSLFGRYMRTTTFWDPALLNSDTILSAAGAGAGGRDSSSQSLAIGDTMVLSNTTVNNIRFTANRTNVHRTHADMFGPQDVGVNIYTPIPNYMLLSVTGAFSINTGTETDSFYRPNTYAISDDLTMVRGDHQWAFGASVGFSDWKTNSNVRSPGTFSFNGSATGLPLADFLLGSVFEFRQSTPFTLDIKQKYFGLYAQDTWRLSPNMTMNYGVRWEPWFPQQHQQSQIYNFDINRFQAGQRSTTFPQAPPGLSYPGDEGFPTKAGMFTEWLNLQPRVGVSWDPTGDGRTSVRAGYGMNSNFIAGEFYFDAAQAPPFGLEQRLINLPAGSLDDPWRAANRANPYPITPGRVGEFPPYALLLAVPYDLETTRVHSWNVGVQQQVGENMGLSASYLGNYLTNVWGDVTGNPGTLPAGLASPTSPCTLRNPAAPGGTQTFPNCSAAPIDVRREITQANPAVGQYIGYLDWVTDAGWQHYHGMLLSFQRRSVNGITANANYTLSQCRGLISQGGGPLNVGTGYMLPVSLINPPADPQALFDADEGPCANSPTHIFNLTASVETPQFANTALRAIASEWRLSGIFRAQSGRALNIITRRRPGADRHAESTPESGAGRSVRRQVAEQLVQSGGVRAARAGHSRECQAATATKSRDARRRSLARAVVPIPRVAPHRSAGRGVQCAQLDPAGATRATQPQQRDVRADPVLGRSAHHAVRGEVFVLTAGAGRLAKVSSFAGKGTMKGSTRASHRSRWRFSARRRLSAPRSSTCPMGRTSGCTTAATAGSRGRNSPGAAGDADQRGAGRCPDGGVGRFSSGDQAGLQSMEGGQLRHRRSRCPDRARHQPQFRLLPVNFYFDSSSGLLVRMVRWNETPVGPVPTQVDYDDYRDVAGVKMPFTWTVSQTYIQMTIKLDSLQPNVPVNAAMFARPAPAAAPRPTSPPR